MAIVDAMLIPLGVILELYLFVNLSQGEVRERAGSSRGRYFRET